MLREKGKLIKSRLGKIAELEYAMVEFTIHDYLITATIKDTKYSSNRLPVMQDNADTHRVPLSKNHVALQLDYWVLGKIHKLHRLSIMA